MSIIRAFQIALLISVVGGSVRAQELRVLDQLNPSGRPFSVGQVVLLRGNSVHTVVDLAQFQPLGMPTGWTTNRAEDKFGLIPLGSEYFPDVCGRLSWFSSTSLQPKDVLFTSLADPYKTLEVFNRPLTGLSNNKEAEIRLQQWRSALNRSLAESSEVYLIVEVVATRSPELKLLGNLADKSIIDSMNRVLSGSKLKPNQEAISWNYEGPYRLGVVKLKDPLVISLKLRKLDRVTESLPQLTQIGFSFAGERVLGWQAAR